TWPWVTIGDVVRSYLAATRRIIFSSPGNLARRTMSEVHCFTSISFSYLDRGGALAATLKRQHPDWKLWVCVSDIDPPGLEFDAAREPFDHVLRIDDLDITDRERWIFGHDLVE